MEYLGGASESPTTRQVLSGFFVRSQPRDASVNIANDWVDAAPVAISNGKLRDARGRSSS
jgi:hypothetical protein